MTDDSSGPRAVPTAEPSIELVSVFQHGWICPLRVERLRPDGGAVGWQRPGFLATPQDGPEARAKSSSHPKTRMTPRRRRMLLVALMLVGIGLAVFFGLSAFQKNLLYFLTPSQVSRGEAPTGRAFRLGGLVVKGTVHRAPDTLAVRFTLSDGPSRVEVHFTGILPDLFREGQGIIAIGQLRSDGIFEASEVLAKHDENYMPPEVADSLKPQSPQMPDGNPAP